MYFRFMKMADGGCRPVHNVRFSSDCPTGVIVGVEVLTTGSDMGQIAPMQEQIHARHEVYPAEVLVDGGYAKHEAIEEAQGQAEGCTVYAPVPKPKDPSRDRHAPYPGDSEAIVAWRRRMATSQAKEIYKERAQEAECVNAQARNRGLIRLLARGRRKVKAIALRYALAHNVIRGLRLRAEAAVAR